MTDYQALWEKSGRKYVAYAKQYPQYRDTNQVITELADLRAGRIIVDLAGGTGLTTSAIIEKLNGAGHIYCVDFAEDMLVQAQRNINSPIVSFTAVTAEAIRDVVLEPIDRVICNAAFWQFRDKDKVLEGIKHILKPDGLFVFDLPQQFYKLPGRSHRGDIIKAVLEELSARGYHTERKLPPRLSEESLRGLLGQYGFAIGAIITKEFAGATLQDGIDFFTIPAVAPFFEGVPLSIRREVLAAAQKRLRSVYEVTPNRWAFFVASLTAK